MHNDPRPVAVRQHCVATAMENGKMNNNKFDNRDRVVWSSGLGCHHNCWMRQSWEICGIIKIIRNSSENHKWERKGEQDAQEERRVVASLASAVVIGLVDVGENGKQQEKAWVDSLHVSLPFHPTNQPTYLNHCAVACISTLPFLDVMFHFCCFHPTVFSVLSPST